MTPRYRWRRRRVIFIVQVISLAIQVILIALMAVTLLIIASSRANATPQQDGRFLYQLGEVGITYGGDANTAIEAGHEVCQLLDNNHLDVVIGVLEEHTQLGPLGSRVFAAISIQTYCATTHGDLIRLPAGGNNRNVGVIA